MTDSTKPLRVTVEDVGRALFQSDACPDELRMTPDACIVIASYMLRTSIGFRAMMDGGVEVDLGPAGILTITHRSHE